MSEYRGFVFDIDKTAVPNGAREVGSKALIAAFVALPPEVIAIAATGRSPESGLPITRQLELTHESVMANGALIVDSQTGVPSWGRLLSEHQVEEIVITCAPCPYQLWLSGDTIGSYTLAADQKARATAAAHLKDVPANIANIVLGQLKEIAGVDAYLSPAWGGVADQFDINIGNIAAKKHLALKEIYRRLGVTAGDMIGVGDGVNDIELFQAVGHKVAVADADPLLIELADEVVPAHDEDGLIEVVKRFHK